MDGIVQDLLLFVSLIAAPIIFGFLLYLGLRITDRDPSDPMHSGKGEQDNPR